MFRSLFLILMVGGSYAIVDNSNSIINLFMCTQYQLCNTTITAQDLCTYADFCLSGYTHPTTTTTIIPTTTTNFAQSVDKQYNCNLTESDIVNIVQQYNSRLSTVAPTLSSTSSTIYVPITFLISLFLFSLVLLY